MFLKTLSPSKYALALSASLLVPVMAEVEVIAGFPVTEAVNEPFSVDFDNKGDLYGVEFTKSNRVFKLSGKKLTFVAGINHNTEKVKQVEQHDGKDPMKAAFHGMHDIQILKGKAILADSFNHTIRTLDLASGEVATIAGTPSKAGFGGDGGPATGASFNITMTGTLSPDRKRLYIADIGNHRVREMDLEAGTVKTVAGSGQKGNPADGTDALQAPLGDARAVTQAEDGTLYVLLRGGNSLVEVKDGKVRTVVNASGKKGYGGDGGDGREALMNGPKYVAMDKGTVLICDTENHCVRRYFPETGKIELVAGTPAKASDAVGKTLLETGLRRPHGVRIGPDGKLYIADTYNNRVLRVK
ncbi:MAG: hypothetical protein KF712_06855 [Akkermansiaceae bacterium]|nr:hypothetical protein [Akkermansiaceae bacterium]